MPLTESQKNATRKYRQGKGRENVNKNATKRYAKKATLPLRREFQLLAKIDIN